MIPFDFQLRTRIVFGPDKVDALGDLAAELDVKRALVVSDPGVIKAGHTARGVESLEQAGIQTLVYGDVHENPNTDDVDAVVAVAKEFQPDLLVGLGGGSSMDCAKGCNFLFTNGGRMQDYWGVGKAKHPMLPMIAVPTTAGTGSETQSFALISDAKTHLKMACGDKKATCRVVILDPKLTITMPPMVTALSGIDALSHALETYVTKRRNSISLVYSRESWRLLAGNFARVLDHPHHVDARAGMQLGACLAGLAIENSMLGATHALTNPLTAHYGLVHGQAIAVMLPHVIRFNGETVGGWYEEMLASLDGHSPVKSGGVVALANFVAELVAKSGLKTTLRDCGVQREQLPQLAADAAQQWTGSFNPRECGEADMLSLYEAAF